MNRKKTGIIGGGASGLMAAAAAGRNGRETEEIVILEKKERIGKKILVTGNGKCNLTNLDFSMERIGTYYNGADPERLRRIFSRFSEKDTLSFFSGLGMLTQSKNGYVYPLSGQASTVLDTLRFELERLGVRILTECRIREIEPRGKKGSPGHKSVGPLFFDRLILACGSPAGEKAGSGMDGYTYAASFGHTVIPPRPALTALRCDGDFWKGLAGVRCDASVQLFIGPGKNGHGKNKRKDPLFRREERGELQLTDYGIPGIPVFQLSRHASFALADGKEIWARIDFLPSFSTQKGAYEKMTAHRIRACQGRSLEVLFCGLVNKKIIQTLLKRNGLRLSDSVCRERENAIQQVFEELRSFSVRVVGTNPFPNAQVCAGGIPLDEVTDQLESKKYPGLYLAGELLHVDGICGGYNLQWAWTSGTLAGRGSRL